MLLCSTPPPEAVRCYAARHCIYACRATILLAVLLWYVEILICLLSGKIIEPMYPLEYGSFVSSA